jgi:hypothetical protein
MGLGDEKEESLTTNDRFCTCTFRRRPSRLEPCPCSVQVSSNHNRWWLGARFWRGGKADVDAASRRPGRQHYGSVEDTLGVVLKLQGKMDGQ